MSDLPDFEAAGLLEGLGEEEIDPRLELLNRLYEEGVELDELKLAVAEGRLAVLPVEHLLSGEPRFDWSEVAERSGVPSEMLGRQWRTLGRAVPAEGEKVLSGADLESAHRLRALLDAGLGPDAISELGRTIAVAMSQFAAASRQLLAVQYSDPDDDESEVSERLLEQTRALVPLVGPTLEYSFKLHLANQLRHAAFDASDLRERAGVAEVTTIAFADLVGFTRLGEELPPEELGEVTARLEASAGEVATGPVRLVKLIGDAAMLASTDTVALLDALHELLELMSDGPGDGDADEEGDDSGPLIRAGVARGLVLPRSGDFFGSPVNTASRVTGIARPASVLVTADVHDEVPDDYRFSPAGSRSLKGIENSVRLFRCRPLDDGEAAPGEADADEGEEAGSNGSRRRRRPRRR